MGLQYANPLMHGPNDRKTCLSTFCQIPFLPLQTQIMFEQQPQSREHKIAKLPQLLAALTYDSFPFP